MTRLLGSIGACVAVVCVLLAAQEPRDQRPAPVTGRGVVSGVVVTDDGVQPVRHAHVRLSGAEVGIGRVIITDETGTFLFSELPAGRFKLSLSKPAYLTVEYGAKRPQGPGVSLVLAAGQALAGLQLKLQKGGVITGRIIDETGEPASRVPVMVQRYTMLSGEKRLTDVVRIGDDDPMTDDRGSFRLFGLVPGEYVIGAGGIPPVYYPGTPIVSNAVTITLALGEERAGIDFALQLVQSAKVEGVVVGLDGAPVPAASLTLVGREGPPTMSGLGPSDVEGRFSLAGIAPGEYSLVARTPKIWAAEHISVNGFDVTGVVLRAAPGMSVSGRLQFDVSQLTGDPLAWHVGLAPILRTTGVTVSPSPASIAANGTFSIADVKPGSYRFFAVPAVPGPPDRRWSLKSVVANGRDIVDLPIEVQPGGDLRDVVVTITDRIAELSGSLVTADASQATADFYIVVFPVNRAFWLKDSRRIVSVRPGNDGRFTVGGLPAGEYYVAALTDVEPGEWFDSTFLAALPTSTRVVLAEGEKKTLDLRIK